MQLHKNTGPVTTVGGGKAMSFGIAANPKMFRILSDQMYQDKPGSIVREVSCNALDSHIMAGIPDKPFTIHLPDQFEPWLSIRDYGVGLSPEAIEKVFCVYGESTKDQSNEAVGAFGLGAKTPFSYTDQFNVTSVYNGKLYAYSIFIDESGIPSIVLMAEADTDEHNGVEIKMGVKPEDFYRFNQAVKNQLRYFPVKPTIENVQGEFVWQAEPAALFKSDTITIFANGGGRVNIVQGPVGYPLEFAHIQSHLPEHDITFLRTMYDVGANLYFPIGAIGVTASREGVEYKGITIDSLRDCIAQAHKDVATWLQKEVDAKPNVYERALFLNENQTFRSIINGVKLDVSPAQKDTSGRYYFNLGGCDAYKVEQEYTDVNGNLIKRKVDGVTMTEYSRNSLNGFTGSRYSSNDVSVYPRKDGKHWVVIRDTNKTPVARMRHFFKEKGLEKMVAITLVSDKLEGNADLVKAVQEHLGGFANVMLVSQMADPPRAAYDRKSGDYSRPTAYMAYGSGSDDMDSVANWKRVYDKLDELTDDNGDDLERAIYVSVDRQRLETNDYEAKRMYGELCRAGVVDAPLFGIRNGDLPKLAKSDIEWIKLEDYVQQKKAEVLANPNIRRYSIANAINKICTEVVGPRFAGVKGLNNRTKLARLMRIGEKAAAVAAAAKVNHYMLRIAAYDADNHPALAAVRNVGKTTFDNIPLARLASRASYGPFDNNHPETKHIVEYINTFDKA